MSIDQLIQLVYSGQISTGQIEESYQVFTAEEISAALSLMGVDFSKVDFSSPDNLLFTHLRENIYAFSAAKGYSMVQDMTAALLDEKGLVRSFSNYKKAATDIAGKYNTNYLQAEYETAVSSAQMAAQWNRYQESKDLLPNLRFVTAGDDRVRDEHAALDGIVRPIDDPFWDNHLPPLGWRCRCDFEQTAAATQGNGHVQVHEYFKHNVGKHGIIFNNNHPYFVNAGNLYELDAVSVYGMKKQAALLADPSKLPALPPQSNTAAYFSKLRQTNGITNTDWAQLTDRSGAKIGVNESPFNAAMHANQLSNVLHGSTEVWKQANHTYHVKLYNNKILAAKVNNQQELEQWLELDHQVDISYMRRGVLMFRKWTSLTHPTLRP